ncbi:hypothetical protein BDA96_09G197000 [Sorghum bicolor]|uniref:Uncharacterized protein n=1 Tax=Sorghum bicolor TaxID=4558 RepID=A0A921QDD5_SORBI|nr:hypothetical protein BDA96_09G197000 [Sorghum bicolor]
MEVQNVKCSGCQKLPQFGASISSCFGSFHRAIYTKSTLVMKLHVMLGLGCVFQRRKRSCG